ncbi:MAG: oligoendopeptidase F [Clostridia bacterium]|nr:oligoendopeptidase F [Clostridia bacterium]
MKRNEIEEKYKWDLSQMYKNKEEFQKDFQEVKQSLPEIEKYKGKFLENSEIFLEFMNLLEKINRKLEKLYTYTHLAVDVEPENAEMQELNADISGLAEETANKTVFIDLEILKNEEAAKKVIENEKCKKYTNMINHILRTKPHILSDETEEALTMASGVIGASYKTYSSIRPEFEPVIIDGKEHFLNEETVKEFYKNPDEQIRKQAYEKLNIQYKKMANVYASTLEGTMKKDVFYSKIRKFKSPLEASVFGDEVTEELFYKVLENANKTYHNYYLEYLDVVKKLMNKEILEVYDLRYPIVKEPSKKYTLDNAFELIYEATKNFGPEYTKIMKKAKEERWIDYMPHEGKRHGAYSSGCYDSNPYILTSYMEDIESIFTLIHELGHSAHTYLSNNNQEYATSDYRIFVAEVASTVNENLLMQLLLQNCTDREEKKYLLFKNLDEFIGCCYRQPFFAEFENRLHQKVANNEGLSNQTITDLYEKLSEEYYGEKVKLHELSKYSCYGVPHFYYNYYVYKYTVGMCVSSVIAKRVFKGDQKQIENYLNFLKSGSSKSPVELLKLAGVNPLDENLYKEAFENFKTDLEEFKKLL